MNFEIPPDPDEQNDDRSDWAALAIAAFEKRVRCGQENVLADLLSDIGHWCDRNGYSFATELQRAISYYSEETGAEGEAFKGTDVFLTPSAEMPPTRDQLLAEIKRLDHNGFLNLEGTETTEELQHAVALLHNPDLIDHKS